MRSTQKYEYRASSQIFTAAGYQWCIILAVILSFACVASPRSAWAITINMNFNSGSSEFPAYDPDGSRLTALMENVATYYEDVYENSGTLDVTFYYYTFSDNTLAQHLNLGTSGGHPTSCRIRVDTDRTWFIDETPFDNSEYNIVQTLAGSISSPESKYDGDVPDLLEYSYKGYDNSSGPPESITGFDLWSVMLHEMGHGMGMTGACAYNETFSDNDYDFNSDLVWGNTMAAKCYASDNRYHLAAATAMYPSVSPGYRKLPSATDLFAIACAGKWGNSVDLYRKEFYSTDTNADLNLAANWSGNRLPGMTKDIWIRDGGEATLSGSLTARDLFLGGGTTVHTANHQLHAYGNTTMGSSSETCTVDIASYGDFIVNENLTIYNGSSINMDTNSLLAVGGNLLLNSGSQLTSSGMIETVDQLTSYGTITLNENAEIDAGFFHSYGTVQVNGNCNIHNVTRFYPTASVSLDNAGDNLYMHGLFHVNPGATISGNGRLWVEETTATCILEEGSQIDAIFKVRGTLELDEHTIIQTSVTQDFELYDTATVLMEINGDHAYDVLNVGGSVVFDGELDLDFSSSYLPSNGDSFTLFTYDSYSGSFDTLDWTGPFDLIADYTSTGLTLTVEYVSGDANRDGMVDGSDATILANNWQQTGADWSMGDFNNDGIVDGSDATLLASNWQVSGGHPASVPEPSIWCGLLTLLLVGWTTMRRRLA